MSMKSQRFLWSRFSHSGRRAWGLFYPPPSPYIKTDAPQPPSFKNEGNFLSWIIQNFVRKVKQFFKKYYSWFCFLSFIIKNCLVLLRNSVNINTWLPSLNIFEEIQFFEIKRETFNSVNLWVSLYKKVRISKNEQWEWKAFFCKIEYTSGWVIIGTNRNQH